MPSTVIEDTAGTRPGVAPGKAGAFREAIAGSASAIGMAAGPDRFTADWLPAVLSGAYMLVTSVTNFFLTVYFSEQLGFSGRQIGILYAIGAVTGMLASFPAGMGNDRVTSRTLVALGLACQGAGFALMALVQSFAPYVFIYFLGALAGNLFRISLDVQVLTLDRGSGTGRRVGLYLAWRFLGLTLGTAGAGYVLAWLDFRVSLIVTAVTCLVLSLTLVRRLAPTRVDHVRLSDYRGDFLAPRVLFFAGWWFLFSTHWGAESTSYGLFLRQVLHLDLVEMGWFMAAEFATLLVSVVLVGKKLDRPESLRRIILAGLFLSGLGHVGMIYPAVSLSLGFRMLHGLGDGLLSLILFVGLARLFPAGHLGGNTGLLNLVMMLGTVLGSLGYGPLGERFGYAFPLWASGATTLLLVVVFLSPRVRKWAL